MERNGLIRRLALGAYGVKSYSQPVKTVIPAWFYGNLGETGTGPPIKEFGGDDFRVSCDVLITREKLRLIADLGQRELFPNRAV